MRRGFLSLVAVMDWFSRRVLAWRLSNTMDVDFCIEALHEAMARFARPGIFNTDSQKMVASSRAVCLKHGSTAVDWRREAPRCGLTRTPIDRRVFPWTCRPPGNTSR